MREGLGSGVADSRKREGTARAGRNRERGLPQCNALENTHERQRNYLDRSWHTFLAFLSLHSLPLSTLYFSSSSSLSFISVHFTSIVIKCTALCVPGNLLQAAATAKKNYEKLMSVLNSKTTRVARVVYGRGETTTQQDTRITTGHIKDIQYIIHLLLCWKSSVLTLMDVTKLQSNMVQIPMPTPKYIINFHAEFHLLSYRNRQCSGISNAKYLVLLSWGYFLAIPKKKKIKQISSVKLKICACYLGTSTERQQL